MRTFNLIKSLTRVINNRKGLLILCLSLAVLGVNEVWGTKYGAKVTATVWPQGTGKVYVGKNTTQGTYSSTSSSAEYTGESSSGTKDFYLFHQETENNNYHFIDWFDGTGQVGTKDKPYKVTKATTDANPAEYNYYALFAELKGTPAPQTLDFGDDVIIGSDDAKKTVKIAITAWSGKVTLSVPPGYTVSPSEITPPKLDQNDMVKEKEQEVTITLNESGYHEGNFTASCTAGTLTYPLKGTAWNKASVTWKRDDGTEIDKESVVLSAGDIFMATCQSGQTITYSDYNTDYFEITTVEGAPALKVKESISGTISSVSVTANLAKDQTTHYAATSDVLTLTITNLTPQYIVWTDDISSLDNEKTLPYTVTLTAVAYDSKTNQPSGQSIEYSYESKDGAISVTAAGVLTVKELSDDDVLSYVTAAAAGSGKYASIDVTKTVSVIDIKTACPIQDSHAGGDISGGGSITVYPTLPSTLSFRVKKSSNLLTKNLIVTEYDGGNNQLTSHTYKYGDISKDGTNINDIPLNSATTRIVFDPDGSPTYTYTISNIVTTRKTEASSNTESLSWETDAGQSLTKTFKVTYSNVPVMMSFESEKNGGKSKWSINKPKVGGCGKSGTEEISISFKSDVADDTYSDILYLKSNTGVDYGSIKLSAKVTLVSQSLKIWNIKTSYFTTELSQLSAETEQKQGDSQFTFSIDQSTPDNIVNLDANGLMTFNGAGSAIIRATEPGTTIYDKFTDTRQITISKVTPTISKPAATAVIYGNALSTSTLSGGKATVTLRGVADTEVTGTWAWKEPSKVITDVPGTHDYAVVFTPTNTAMYNSVESTITVTVNKANPTLEVTNPEAIKIYIDDTLTPKIDLVSCIKNYSAESDSHGHTQNKSAITYSCGQTGAVIEGKMFHATAAGTYTITATAPATDYYNEASETITITVGKHTPSITWKTFEHIYAGDILEDVASTSFLDNPVELELTYEKVSGEFVVEGNKLLIDKQYTVAHEATVKVTTTETDYYAPTSEEHTYYLEVKKLPKFYLNGVEMPTSPETTNLTLKVGETANVSFEQIEESAFTYTTNAQFVSYAHNSENHTGVITATASGNEGFQFHQAGTTTVFDRTCQMHIWVNKHADTLDSPIHDNDIWMVDSVYTGEMYTIKDDGYTGHTQEGVSISCDNESVIRYQQDGSWKAVGEGTATITIKQINNAYWTGDTITRIIKVQKHTPVITWNIDGSSYAWGSVINNPVSSTNTDVPFTVTSNNPSVANYVNGHIEVYNTTGTVTFTLAQEGNYKWNAATTNLTCSFSTFQPKNHVPFTLDNNNNSNFFSSNSGTYKWSNGYKVGNGTINTFNKNTSSVTIKFTGVPDKLSFTKTLSRGGLSLFLPGDGDCNCFVYESADGSSWSQCWKDVERVETKNVSDIQLQPTTRYLKFEYNNSCVYCTYSNINVTERSSIEPVANSLDFGTGYNGNTAAKRTVDVNWYSVMPCTVAISGADASQFYLAEDSKTIASMLDNSGSTTLSVFYAHEENKSHSATLTITSGDTPAKTATIQLSGTTDRAPQEIIWREDITPLPHNGGLYEGAALASSGGEVVLTSEDESIVKVVNGGLQPMGVGKTIVHAYQAGDDIKWQPVNATKEIEVTSLSVQHLTWNDQLNNIKRSEGNDVNITLTAQSDAVASDPSLVVTYELDDNAKTFASVSGNQLTITGWGSGYITAKQAGNANYIATQKVKPIISRNPDADCKMLAGEYWEEYTLHTIASKEIDILNGEPATIEFDAKMDLIAVGEGLHLDEWYDNSWHEFKYIDWDVMAKNLGNYAHYGPYNLNRKTTKVRFYTNTGATMTRTFKNVEITLARYLELAQNDMSFAGVDKGAFLDQTFYINYSNLRGTLDVGLQNTSSNLQVITTTVGNDCGEIGQMVPVKIRCTGNVCGTENNVIVLSNKEQKLEVPVSATVVPPSQNITWSPQTTILTTDFVALNATCTSNLPISYSSNNTDVATVQQDGSGVWSMTIIKDGTVTITASQAGNADWSPAPDKNVTFNISKATPVVTTWATPSEVVKWTTLANTPLTGGEASVSGTFSWQDGTEQVERGNSGYTMVFTPTNTNWYNTVTNTVVVPVSKDPQTITWNYSPQPIFCNAQLTFDATASSGLTVRYETSDANVAYVNGNNLVIISGGKVTITAIQDGDDTWAYASLSKEIEILRWTPTIKTLPTANSMLIGQLLDNATLTGGVAVVNEKQVDGSFAWKEGSTTTIDIAGTATRTVIFTPSNPNHYNSTTCEVSVEVNKYAPVIAHNLTASTITYGQALNVSTLNGTLTATDKVKQPNVEVEGTFGWFDPTLMLNAGGQKAIVRFSPTNSDWYNYVDIEIPVQVNKATANATPSAAAIKYGQKVSESNLTNGGTTPGTWTWTDNKKEDILPVGVHDHLSVHFVPTDNANYLEADGEVSLTVNKATPTLTWTEKANTANALEQKTFTASSTNTDDNAVITYSITSGTDCATINASTGVVTMIKKGTITITASQAATDNFTEASAISTTCEISPAPTHIVTLPTINDGTPIEIGTQLDGLVLTGGEVQNTINNNGVEGTFAITGGNIFTVGATSITITFTPNNTEVYAGCSTNAEVTIHADDYYQFTGNDNTSWTNGSNWGGTKGTPSSDEDAKVIIVSGTLDITSNENVNVTDLTILPTGTVHVHGDLSVNGTTIEGGTYGDLFVHNGGIATIGNDASLTVNNFVIETSIGTEGQSASGQVHNESNIIYTTGAYIDIYMDPNGKMDDTQWYAFTVPFPVDVQSGIARKEGDTFRKCTYGVEYMICEYDINQRLNTGKGWKYIKSGKLQPGRFYYFTVNGDYNVYSFKAAENTITINNTAELKVNGEGADANWNAVGNSTLTYTTISGEKIPNYVQTYLNGKSQYMTVATSDAQFVVGCPFFFQASEEATMILNEANTTVDVQHYAPRQESLDKPVCVRIAEEGKHFSDQIYLTASQEATGEYTLGRDLAKAGIGTKSAQLWMNAYGQKLSVQDATLMGDQAYYELSIYAPKAGSYELSLPKTPANAVIYLTQDGYPIWNLNEMPYVIECYKGTTNEYGLLLRLQEGGSPTDMQTMRGSEKVQKIMKDQRIYINANTQLYDLMGQKVK